MRYLLGIPLVLLASAGVAQADENPPPKNSAALDETLQGARFTALVSKGDRERAAGKLAEAVMAYAEAFKMKDDPIVGGRLGALLVLLGNPIQAADLLLDAIDRGQGVSAEERHAWLTAYDKARAEVCRLEVTVSEAHARVTLDGAPKNRDGLTGFTLFVPPGAHELRASLKGFEDAVIDFNAIKGGTMQYTLVLRALPTFTPIETPERLLRRRKVDLAANPELPPEDEPPKAEPIRGGVEGEEARSEGRGSVYAGPVMVFGVMSWTPAVGPVIGARYRPNAWLSIGAEGRAAWLPTGVGGAPISAMTAGGLATLCGHYKWAFGCAVGHLGMLRMVASEASFLPEEFVYFRPGLGGRLGAKARLGRSYSLEGSFEILGLPSGVKIGLRDEIIASQPPVMMSVQVGGGWEF
ncbi:hypothetical protein [Polyangium spumosum]|uniref:PEGA domain-containing protein n=1 Tax=Polyangium spumosum TaxID=889282 RepID=A0A6N7PLU2_9BACT|nr:hypothetical protein [Polyangium spumosum]MRG92988.1 hypothetical protein [Polyangium spumosum]